MTHFKNIFANILVVIFGYIGMVFLKLIDETFNLPTFDKLFSLAIFIITIGIIIRLWASLSFTKNKLEVLELNAQQKLIVTGPYKYSRNPLYVGMFLITFGFVLLSGSVLGLLFTLCFFIYLNFYIKRKEEKDLQEKFGSEYTNYKLKVNRWI